MSTAIKVRHNLKERYFFIQMENSAKSVLEYIKLPNSVIEMYHTEVPPEHRGRGVAEKLTREAFQYCLQNKYKVLPTCGYVAKYCKEIASAEERKAVVEN